MSRSLRTASEARLLRTLSTPERIQVFLDHLRYSHDPYYRSPRDVIRDRTAHCFDGAVFAAAALEAIGEPPLLLELLPNDRDDDHIIAVYRRRDRWGAVAKSNYVGLRWREPVYQSLRELVMTYFEPYFNLACERTLRGYTAPLNLRTIRGTDWFSDARAMDSIADGLDRVRKHKILTPAIVRSLTKLDPRSYRAGLTGADLRGLFKVGR